MDFTEDSPSHAHTRSHTHQSSLAASLIPPSLFVLHSLISFRGIRQQLLLHKPSGESFHTLAVATTTLLCDGVEKRGAPLGGTT